MRQLIFFLLFCTCLPGWAQQHTFFTASTPCDAALKMHLGLDTSTAIDFIRWQLSTAPQQAEAGQFELKINYGLVQNNTSGFINGGHHRLYDGQYAIRTDAQGPVLHLQAQGLKLQLRQIHPDLLLFLDEGGAVKIGNGGWSYCLNRQPDLPALTDFSEKIPQFSLFENGQLQATFDGRTPCREISDALDLGLPRSCIKLKWRIIFQQHQAHAQAGTFVLKRIFRQAEQTSGKWSLENQSGNSVIKMQFDGMDKTLHLLQIGEGVLIFSDQQGQPYVGNADFSFGLNRKGE
jgi:hypothetical protein